MKKIVYLDQEERKKRINKIMVKVSNKALIVGLFIIIFGIMTFFKLNYTTITTLKYRAHEREQEVALMQKKVDELEKRIEELNTLEGVEKEAREKLSMVKKGEKIIKPVIKKNE
ncbi:MAG: septum formation initiator family protein [Candidatus Muiribacteriota bacterium]